MAMNPEVQEKCREEILSILPSKETPLTGEKLNKLNYLRATIKETMRLAPVSLGTMRNLEKDIVLSGYRVPKRVSYTSFLRDRTLLFFQLEQQSLHSFYITNFIECGKN